MQHKKCITLLVPELFNHLKQENPSFDLPKLSLALSKSSIKKLPNATSLLACVAKCLNSTETNHNARAALHLSALDENSKSWVCYASPVLIQPNRDHLSIVQAEGFDLSISEATNLCAEFNDYFKEDGLQFSFTEPNTWFCFSEEGRSTADHSPNSIIGENILAFLPSELSDVHWRKVFNETQMLLHHSATNKHRISHGKAEINSLWFWGGGTLMDSFSSGIDQIFSNNPEVQGLGKLGQSQVHNLSKNIDKESIKNGNEHLFVIDFQYCSDIYALLDEYIDECMELLKNNTITTLQIVPEYETKYSLTAKDLKKFWKRTQRLSSFI